MKYLVMFIVALLPPLAMAAAQPVEIPLNQHLSAVDYFRDGRQSGCGLRATAESHDSVWLNVLITVFLKPSGVTLGVAKVVARKAHIGSAGDESGQGITFSSIGKIQQAWIKAESGGQPTVYRNGQSSHSDGYMTPMEFAETTRLLAAIAQENFRVGISLDEEQPDQVFEFNQRPDQAEINKLSACMSKLRNEITADQRRQVF
ncbi:MAG: hypothetical protein ACOY3V_01495 [Pseudomonadota bacterium]